MSTLMIAVRCADRSPKQILRAMQCAYEGYIIPMNFSLRTCSKGFDRTMLTFSQAGHSRLTINQQEFSLFPGAALNPALPQLALLQNSEAKGMAARPLLVQFEKHRSGVTANCHSKFSKGMKPP